jgi:hypothetical protein
MLVIGMHPTRATERGRPATADHSNDKQLHRLRRACRLSLERYIDEASLYTGHLLSMNPGSLSGLSRLNLARLSQRQELAHATYVRARQALASAVMENAQPDSNPKDGCQ